MNEFTRPDRFDHETDDNGQSFLPRVRRGGMRWGQGVNKLAPPSGYKMVPVEKVDARKIDIQVYGEYQLFGDIETDEWEKRTFEDNKADGTVIDHSLLYVTTGAWGLRFVTFMFDTSVDVGPTDHIRAQAQDILFKLVGESDVELRYITML